MSTTVAARLADGRAIDETSFTDITESPASVEWGDDGLLVVEFPDDLPAATRRRVRCRIISTDAAEEALMNRLADLAAEDPTTVADRLLRLEQAVTAVARLLLRDEA